MADIPDSASDALFDPIPGDLLADRAASQIEMHILNGLLKSGAKLPGERDLAQQLDVSRPKLRYAHQGGSCPPRIVVHGTQADAVPRDYQRYLENTYRRVLKVEATPIRFEFRSPDNPFEGRKNTLNKRQKQKKARLMQHVKKNEKQSKRRKKRG